MATEPTEGDLVAFADDLLLVESVDVLTILGFKIGHPSSQPVIAIAFEGRVNRSETRRTVHVALSPQGMAELVRTIAESYEGATTRDAFGRSADA